MTGSAFFLHSFDFYCQGHGERSNTVMNGFGLG
jgi:hypothetical protein